MKKKGTDRHRATSLINLHIGTLRKHMLNPDGSGSSKARLGIEGPGEPRKGWARV